MYPLAFLGWEFLQPPRWKAVRRTQELAGLTFLPVPSPQPVCLHLSTFHNFPLFVSHIMSRAFACPWREGKGQCLYSTVSGTEVLHFILLCFIHLFLKIYLIERERVRASTEREREKQTPPNWGSIPGPRDHNPSGRQTLN